MVERCSFFIVICDVSLVSLMFAWIQITYRLLVENVRVHEVWAPCLLEQSFNPFAVSIS
jgi:hypothetical protein